MQVETVETLSAESLAWQEIADRRMREALWPEAAQFLREASNPPTTLAGMAAFRERWGDWLLGRTGGPVWPNAGLVA
jgi:hypothetical protein